MRRFIWVLTGVLLGMLVCQAAFAGGTVPTGFGLYQDGRSIDTVPASDSNVRWYSYGSSQTLRAQDELAYAMASVDIETLDYRVLYGGDAPAPEVLVAVSFKSGDPAPECLDDVDGNCTLARTECLESVRDGAFRLCTLYRILVYPANIKVKADTMGIPWEERLYSLMRHEMGHVMGLAHGQGGPMANGAVPFTACQLAKWRDFDIDAAATSWARSTPIECSGVPQAQRVSAASCPSVE